MHKNRPRLRPVTCADCALIFDGFPQTRRCPKCARTRNLAHEAKWRKDHIYMTRAIRPDRKLAPDHHKRRCKDYEPLGTVPGTEWVMALRMDERTPTLALQRVPADRMEAWIEEYLRLEGKDQNA